MSINFLKEWQSESRGTNVPKGMNKNIHMAKVISVDDTLNVGRIKVFIDGIDSTTGDETNIPFAYPLMSRIVHVMPKVGEAVLVFLADNNKNYEHSFYANRFWIGPIISNYEYIKNDNHDVPGGSTVDFDQPITKNLTYDPLQKKSKPKKETEADIFPVDSSLASKPESDLDNVTLVGRNNTDIIQSKNKVTTRAGKHKKDDPTKLNLSNPSYSILEFIDENTSYGLTASNEIFLISHKGRYRFKKILTNEDIEDLRKNTQSMLYGELTVKYLQILTNAFLSHIHQHPQNQPVKTESVVALEAQLRDIQNLLAKNIKIN
jgi:hypothetical protein